MPHECNPIYHQSFHFSHRYTSSAPPPHHPHRFDRKRSKRPPNNENILDGRVVSNTNDLATIDADDGCMIDAVSGYTEGDAVRIHLRPEDVAIAPDNDPDRKSSAQNCFPAKSPGSRHLARGFASKLIAGFRSWS